jgi:hypothetical protein
VPRLYGNGSDPWELIPNVSIDPMSAESFHNMTIAVCTVIAAGGAFYNPLVGLAISTAWMATIVERSNTLCDMRERTPPQRSAPMDNGCACSTGGLNSSRP